ncbi:MAG: hypothetical protein ACI4W6_02135 [Acutalibacteraceae bacterium]
MSNASKTAIGAMAIALSVIILMPTAIEIFVYALPAFAGLITAFCVIELNKKWALGVYAATSIIGLLVITNKEAIMMYVAFFGYYAIVKSILESKLPKVAEYICKFLIFNVSVVAATFILIKVFAIPFDEIMGIESDSVFWRKFAVPIMLLLGNVVFILFDFLLTRVITLYINVWQKKFHKMFRFK